MHDHTSRPSGAPSFKSDFSKTFSVATGNSLKFSLTSSEITTFKKYKGFGLQATATDSKAQYSVCSGTMKVKITYKE